MRQAKLARSSRWKSGPTALALPLPSSFRDLAGRGHIVATTSKWDWLASFDFIRPNRVEDSVILHGFEPLHFFLNDKS